MNQYLKWNKQTITDFSDENINRLYNDGYLFGRVHKGYMWQTRSLRIDLQQFKLTSENKRILRKTENLIITNHKLPIANYDWHIGKMAKDFYETKFGINTFSANKVKELLTTHHNFDLLFIFNCQCDKEVEQKNKYQKNKVPLPYAHYNTEIGYSICKETNKIVHYCYPFYLIEESVRDMGLGMMLQTILYAQKHDKKYVYLGSATRPTDIYKLQFEGLEWFDGKEWNNELASLKKKLKKL